MGIRIHKTLGYGTDKLTVDKYGPDMPCIDREAYFEGVVPYNLSEHAEAIVEAFQDEYGCDLEHAKQRLEHVKRDLELIEREGKKTEAKLYCDFEFSEIPAMVFVPPGQDDWHRYDDIIDYYDNEGGSKNSFRYLNVSYIYPLYNQMRRFRGEQRFDWEKETPRIEGGRYNQLTGYWDANIPPIAKGDDLKDLQENWRPCLPAELLAWLYCQPWITDKVEFCNMLRPCIYVYWS